MWTWYTGCCDRLPEHCTCDPADDTEHCHCCSEAIPEGAGGKVDGEGKLCQDCFVEWKEEKREGVTRC